MTEVSHGDAAPEQPASALEPLAWTVHPFRERMGMGILILGMILGVSALAAIWTRSGFWAIFSFAVLFLSLESFYFPTGYLLEEKKMTVIRRFSRSEREWKVFRRCYADRDGLTLSPFTRSSWLESYRAIRLRFSRENRERVTEYVRGRLGSEAEWIQDRHWKSETKPA